MMAAGWPRSALAWACLVCVVGFSTAAAEPGEVERGLPGPVGRLVACETKMLGCLVAIGAKPGHLGWQPLGIEPAVPFASHELGARITYRGLDALGGGIPRLLCRLEDGAPHHDAVAHVRHALQQDS